LNNKVYNQAVFEWSVTRLATKTVRFGLNRDGKIDVDSWMSDEMKAIRDAGDDAGYDRILFLVNNPSDGTSGFMDFNQKWGFIHADISPHGPRTCAHELGHGMFGLRHTDGTAGQPTDPDNVMAPTGGDKWRLRKFQWDIINP
jgi:hypothetical protein